MAKTNSVAKSTAIMSIATLCSRITGLLRTWTMAFALGNTVITSAYQVSNNMPNVIFEFIAGGLIGAAFIPIFMLEKEKHGKKGASYFSSNMLNLTIIILGIVSLLAILFAPAIISTQTFTVSETSEVTALSIFFFKIFAFQIMFYGVSGILQGILNGERIYFIPAIAPALNNVVVIASFITFFIISPSDPWLAMVLLAVGTTLGVVAQTIIQIPLLKKAGIKWKLIINIKDPALFDALKIALPTFIYIVGNLIAFSCRNAFSISVADNGPATILYAWTWYQLPYGIIAVSLSRTMFTEMSEAYAKKHTRDLQKLIKTGISSTIVLILPLAVLMCVFSESLLSLFRAGNFNTDDVSLVASVLRVWAISLPFYSVMMYLYNVFAAIRKFGKFAFVSCVAVVLQCILYWLLCSNKSLGLIGIPVADIVYYVACVCILIVILGKKVGSIEVGFIIVNTLKVFVASAGAGILGILLLNVVNLRTTDMLNGFIQLGICGGLSLIVVFALCWLFRVPEVLKTTDKIVQKFKRKKGKHEC